MNRQTDEEDTMGIIQKTIQRITRRARIEIVLGDITTQEVDAIVNAAKPSLLGGGGVDGAIHRAGGPAILAECRKLRVVYRDGLPEGRAVPTTAGRLPSSWVIHTVGPHFPGSDRGPWAYLHKAALLRDCYTESLHVADALDARTVAFPLISSGAYGWPAEDAIDWALHAIRATRTRVRLARLVLFDEDTYRIAQRLLQS